jgi:hypothetical protein
MMKLIYKNVLLLILVIGVAKVNTQANTLLPGAKTEFTKTVKKNYKMSADGDVSLSNKYGKINLKTWDRNEVVIEVTITAHARSESAANDIFNRINIDFANGSDYVKAETQIETQKSSWWSSGDKGDFRIDYEVSMPKAASLDLSNKYGDSEIAAIGGDANIVVKYGNFNVLAVGKDTKIDLGYGNGTVGEINDAEIVIKYSKIKLKAAEHINVDSKYSKVYIDKANKIKSTSKYDTYELGELKELSNEGKYDHFEIERANHISAYSKYTDFKIEELYSEGAFELSYGGLAIESLKKGFKVVSMDCEYTDCKIYLDDNTAFQLDAISDYASIKYPGDMEVTVEKTKNSNQEVKGYRGNASAGMIKARLRYGGLKVR